MIRPACGSDVSAVGDLLRLTIQGAKDTATGWISDRIDCDTGIVLVDRPGEHLRGFIVGQVVADEAEIHDLGVQPGLRRTGIGRALIQEFEAVARNRGATTCILEVRTGNAAARAIYIRTGYAEVGQRDAYYSDGEHAVLMRHELRETH